MIPAPSKVSFGLAETMEAAGILRSIGPDGWHVSNDADALAFIDSYDPLPAARQHTLERLGMIFGGKFVAGFSYSGGDGIARVFQIDQQSQFNIDARANAALGAIVNGEGWSPAAYFIDAANGRMPTPTAESMRLFAQAAHNYVAGLILRNRDLKDAIVAAGSVAALEAIDIAAGWPPNG